MTTGRNIDHRVVEDFGVEWNRFDQSTLSASELERLFNNYFEIFPWDQLPGDARGFDLGCGSGRWARLVAPRVGTLHCIDPSVKALEVARSNLVELDNCQLHLAGVDAIPLDDASMDFGYSLGVLHHVPDTSGGIQQCVSKLKAGAPFLVYLYYAFDNRPSWFRLLWKVSEIGRKTISELPSGAKLFVTQAIAIFIYYPLARLALLMERVGANVELFPLSAYRDKSFYTMRTDALDRFGTRIEKRFTRAEIEKILRESGLEEIKFSDRAPYWVALGRKAARTTPGGDGF